jgi:hypothetical protein
MFVLLTRIVRRTMVDVNNFALDGRRVPVVRRAGEAATPPQFCPVLPANREKFILCGFGASMNRVFVGTAYSESFRGWAL